ncbi:TPA: hypothetical protein N0F65_006874 [Lagenidium giganteum]|uniref:Peptide hydrolase n=1 Tax=Lagenidium giganteum TaxID=4803 RepID=A0AAV2ZJH4_9STRA|nr:TPA: hypothetical protein N0F65_006874 [Lagenidium giganteum]
MPQSDHGGVRRRQHAHHAVTTSSDLAAKDGPGRARSKHHESVPRWQPMLWCFIGFYAFVVLWVSHRHAWLPEPLPVDAPSHRFSEARARVVLEKIMSFGYRPVGSQANEVLTPEYLVETIEEIKFDTKDTCNIELHVQRPSGAFGLDFLAQFQNIYSNVTNIVVRLTPRDALPEALNNSLMISSHYDAAIGAAAASDDGVSVAIMMELLRYFAAHSPKYASLVFNFNGAEETIMQAAHGFITQHPWKDTIRAFINLEAAGASGRELLFQTGSDELALAYVQGAKYPHASIIAQEVFQSGVIPADTDYRVYRDFGYVAGMDFAYIANGYVYHTSLDDVSRIEQGAIQRLGDNIAGVIHQLANTSGRLQKVAATPESSNTLFFDIAGYIMISMAKRTSITLCTIVLVAALVYSAVTPISVRLRLSALKLLCQCLGTSLAFTLAVALVLTLFAPLSWYSQPYLAAAAFLPPALAGMLHRLGNYLHTKALKSSAMLWQLEESLFEAIMCFWVIGLVLLLAIQAISSYVMALWIAFPLVGQMLCHSLQRMHLLSSSSYIVISLASVAIPVLHSAFILAIAFTFSIPLMGRSGTVVPPDVVVALAFWFSAMVMLSYSSRFFCFMPLQRIRQLRNAMLVITLNVLVVASLRNPYSDDCPMRVWIQHVERRVVLPDGQVQSDSGLWLNGIDFRRLSPIKPFLANTQWRNLATLPAPEPLLKTNDIYAHMPYVLPIRDLLPEQYSWYLPCAAPQVETPANLRVVSSKFSESTNRRTIHLHFTGPSHLDLFIDAKSTRLTSWSIGNGRNGPVPESNDTYILQFSSGTPPSSFHFWIEAEGSEPIGVVYVGHFLENMTPEAEEMLAALPSWTNAPAAVSTWTAMEI